MTLLLGILVASGCLAAVVIAPSPSRAASGSPDLPRICSMEAKLCPDGTPVSRGGPRCEFPACREVGSVNGKKREPLGRAGRAVPPPRDLIPPVGEPGRPGEVGNTALPPCCKE